MDFLTFVSGIFIGLWAWPILLVAGLLILFAFGLAYEREGWVSGAVVIMITGTLVAFGNQWTAWDVGMWVGIYALIGVLMTYPLYNSYSRRRARAWREHKASYSQNSGSYADPVGSMIRSWNNVNVILKVEVTEMLGTTEITIQKGALVGQMILWALYWPSYGLVMVLRDVVRNFFEMLVERLGGHFARMSNGHFNAV